MFCILCVSFSKKGQTEPVLSTVSVTLPDTFNFTKNELVFFKMLYIGK